MTLSNVVYRSRATVPLSGNDLLYLTRAAQARNEVEAITGLVLHDDGHFFQWLEGPQDSLTRVMASIANDRRHTDIKILGHRTVQQRVFDGWTMKLAVPGSLGAAEVVKPPTHVIETLRRRPDHAVTALAELAPAQPQRTVRTGLEAVIRSHVIPELAARHGLGKAGLHPDVGALVRLLLQDATGPVERLLETAAKTEDSLLGLRVTLIEPAARELGDMWLDDSCTEVDVLLGLSRLQSAMRGLAGERIHRAPVGSRGRVLVALLPSETHLLGLALAFDALHEAGWGVTVAFPPDVDALEAQLRAERFDALHLTLSDAFGREGSLPLLRRAVRMARSTTIGRRMRITVGGRVFAERTMSPGSVGADAVA